MPCDTIRTVTTILETPDPAALTAGLAEEGMSYSESYDKTNLYLFDAAGSYVADYNKTTRKLTVRETRSSQTNADQITAQVKRAYSAGVVLTQAKKYGWQIKKLPNRQYQVIKRA